MTRKFLNSRAALIFATGLLFLLGLFILWVASLRIPDLADIKERRIDQSTKIYDRTGEILLYDMARDQRRAEIPINSISYYAKAATIAIEDKNFYSHHGFELRSFLRAVLVNLTSLSFSQGGSTITQQVVKNSILTKDKTPTRKLKELILAVKLDNSLSKDEILSLYLNEIPYGGTIYGIEEAARSFFGKSALDLTLAEAAHLASLPKAPSYYSPYGTHRDELENRKNLVLKEMLNNNFISQEEYDQALAEKVDFKTRLNTASIRAPHFVFFVIDRLAKEYGEDTLLNNGLKVVTTLDYSIQEKAEEVAKKYGPINKQKFNGENNAIIAIDPKTGDTLAMVGSRDYFDAEIDGNFNAATGHRQPGSTFKPFVYSVLFNKGYTDNTLLFDTQIQFNPNCASDNFTTDDKCYSPGNYDDKFRGPITIRNALAQSVNIPAVEALYLAGVKNSIAQAESMGIESLTDIKNYGLSLVLGGGSVSLIDMTSAYSVFANDGIRNPQNAILRIEDSSGNILDQYIASPERVLPEQSARLISDILSDNTARMPAYGPSSALYISSRDVAVKTGTSNDYKDAWIIGYAPNIALGAWVGNNDNSAMEKKVAGLIVSPMWRELMDKILPNLPQESFFPPEKEQIAPNKPLFDGQLLSSDPQYNNWQYAINRWLTPMIGSSALLNTGNLYLPPLGQ
ncbi:MAG: PBP1A family penicillin-binding protein [Candidatus Zambryskibacteria bacterium]|nr:PBP1A family penicillin-binding protein [Candidatus Zambryskibacteria bacterium]